MQAWCALAPEGYVDYEGRGVPYDTFGRYFQNWGDSDATAEALPELLEYERTRMDSAPPEVEDALSEAVNALESYIAELKAGNWDAIALESSHENALAVNPAWKNLAVFEAVYCGETSGTG